MSEVNNWFNGEDDGVNAWSDGYETDAPDPGTVGRVLLADILPRVFPDEPISVLVFVASPSGNPVAGSEVTLTLDGVTITTPDPQTTAATGYTTFEITPESEGILTIRAEAGGVESNVLATTVAIAVDPTVAATKRAAEEKRRRRAQRRAEKPSPTWMSIGPASVPPAPRPAFGAPLMQAPQPMPPAVMRVVQGLGQVVQQQQQALAQDIARIQSFLR